ncbi:hypothetical protein HJC23_009655 [Cyclotella cryptica]|uniref:Uncharacterized protein n=1 Tax=Cyclotella cryptica TaxID=29204 RepID=A0ABD3PWW0_9STRA|eukprot:CCRYP_010922-RA/>CCRYP_010922-RA protein AED:0.00 eAED:0.00 QI:186/1/1/1/0.5/0.42/7/3131/242
MKIPIVFLTAMVKVAATSNLRRIADTPESRDLQTIIYGTDGRDGRRRGNTLFIVEDDNSRSTQNCAEDTADEFDRDFDDIFIGDSDNGAKVRDIVAVIDSDTNCEDLWAEIERELEDSHYESTVYVYYGTRRRYYRNQNKRGYRLNWGRKNRRSKKSSKDKDRRHKTWSRDKDRKDKWYKDRSSRDKDHENNRNHNRERDNDRKGNWYNGRDKDRENRNQNQEREREQNDRGDNHGRGDHGN